MRLQTLTTLLLLPLATIVAGADVDPPGDRPSNGDQCENCEDKKVCDTCVTTKIPFTSRIPEQSHTWVETKVVCTAASETKACATP